MFDIETVPDGSVWKRPGDPGDQEREHRARTDHSARDRESSFPPAYAHMPIAIGGLWLDENYQMRDFRLIGDGKDERGILSEFSRFVEQNRPALVTYNGRAFDLPVIALRSLRHGVAMPWYYQGSERRYRYSLEDHIDLCDWLADHGATRMGSLDALAKLIGLPGKLGIDGSQVEALYRSGQLDVIRRYCLTDVAQTALLFVRFRLLQGVLDRDEYRSIIGALTARLCEDARIGDVMRAIDGDRLMAA